MNCHGGSIGSIIKRGGVEIWVRRSFWVVSYKFGWKCSVLFRIGGMKAVEFLCQFWFPGHSCGVMGEEACHFVVHSRGGRLWSHFYVIDTCKMFMLLIFNSARFFFGDQYMLLIYLQVLFFFLWSIAWIWDRDLCCIHYLNRWSGSIPMSPVEGRNDVFQVVCNLTPGHHQVN